MYTKNQLETIQNLAMMYQKNLRQLDALFHDKNGITCITMLQGAEYIEYDYSKNSEFSTISQSEIYRTTKAQLKKIQEQADTLLEDYLKILDENFPVYEKELEAMGNTLFYKYPNANERLHHFLRPVHFFLDHPSIFKEDFYCIISEVLIRNHDELEILVDSYLNIHISKYINHLLQLIVTSKTCKQLVEEEYQKYL